MRPYMFLCIGLFSLLIALERSDALRIRTRRAGALAGFSDPYGLSGAYSALYNQRKRLDLNDRLNDAQYLDLKYGKKIAEPDLSDILPDYYAGNSDLDDAGYNPNSMFENSYGARKEESYPYTFTGYGDSIYAPQKRAPYRPHRVSPTVEELRRLFGHANLPVKRIAPVRRRDFPRGIHSEISMAKNIQNEPEVVDNESESESDSETDKANLAAKMKELIDAAAQLSKDEIEEVEESPSDVIEEIRVEEMAPPEEDVHEELVKVFKEAQTPEGVFDVEHDELLDSSDDSNEDDTENNPETTGDDMDRMLHTYVSQAQRKAKRGAADGYVDDIDKQMLLNEIEDLKEDVESLELLQVLSNKENDYLANALKYATLDQLDDQKEYVATEYNDISKATETEELIQMLSSKLGENDVEAEAKQMLGEYMDNEVNTDNLGQGEWYNEPVDDDDGETLQADFDDDVNDVTALDPYGSEFPINIPYPDEDEVEEDDDSDDDGDDVDDIVLGDEELKGNLLQQVLSGMSPAEVENMLTQAQMQQELEEDEGVCKEVLALSDGCAFADAFAIPIDDEARKLCVRHEMCYTCGMAVGLSGQACDEGYRDMVMDACRGDGKCLRNAMTFLKLMSSYHTYESYSPQLCAAPCIEQTIYGVP